jgi:hypothetical protein
VLWCALSLFILLVPILNAQLERSPLSGGVLAARAFKDGRLKVVSAGEIAVPDLGLLACGPPVPCIFPNKQASEGGAPVNEDPVAVNPNNGKQLLSGGNDYNCGNIQGFFASSDGGSTWTRKCSPGSGGQGDPIVGYDLNNVAFAGGIQNGSIVIFKSTNNGGTWGNPITVVGPQLGFLADKPWMEIDTNAASPNKNNIYISTTQFSPSSDSQIWVSRSTDGGQTWKSVAAAPVQHFPTSVDQFSDLAVGPDGTVYLHWLRCPASAGECGGAVSKMMFSKSTDAGKTWSTPSVAATVTLAPDFCGCAFYGSLPNTNERMSDIPANAASGSGDTAKVYITYYSWSGSQMQVFVASSADGGTTWGAPVRINTANHGDQFFPWINLNKAGTKVGVTWLDRKKDPANLSYQPFYARSADGVTYGSPHVLSKTKSNPLNDGFGGGFMGDYRTHVWTGKKIYAVWMDTRTGTSQDEIGGVQF